LVGVGVGVGGFVAGGVGVFVTVAGGEPDVGEGVGVVTGEAVPGLGDGVSCAVADGAMATATTAAAPSPTKIG
jgi:hypothetical protein